MIRGKIGDPAMALKTTARSDHASRFDKLILRRLRLGFHVLMLRRAHLFPAMPTLPDVGAVAERGHSAEAGLLPYAPLAAFWRAVH